MKKYLVVLLIAVLAISSAFASDLSVTGSVSASATWDFDAETFNYGVEPSLNAYVCVSDYIPLSKKGESVPYVDASIYASYIPTKDVSVYDLVDEAGYYLTSVNGGIYLGISSFKIVGEKWVLDFYPSNKITDYASDAIDSSYVSISEFGTEVSYVPLSYAWGIDAYTYKSSKYPHNLAFTYDGIGTLTVSGKTDHTTNTDFEAVFESAEQTFEDVTAQAAFGYSVVKNELNDSATNKFGTSLKVAYKDIVSVASDMGVTKVTGKDAEFDADVALHVAYAPVTLDAYYATEATAELDVKYTGYDTTKSKEIYDEYTVVKKDLVSFKTVFDFAENYGTTLTVTLKDVAHDARKISAIIENTSLDKHTFTFAIYDMTHKATKDGTGLNVEFDAAVEVSEELSAYVGLDAYLAEGAYPGVEFGAAYEKGAYAASLDAYITTGQDKFEDTVSFAFTASYTAEKYVAAASVYYNDLYSTISKFKNPVTGKKTTQWYSNPDYGYTTAKSTACSAGLYLDFSLTSETIVDGAELCLEWETGDLCEKNNFGTLTASCTVEF